MHFGRRLFEFSVPALVAVAVTGCAGVLHFQSTQVVSRPRTQVIKPSETLYSIAWHYGLDYHVLAAWNGIKPPYTIYPGQRLILYPPRRRAVNAPSPEHRGRRAIARGSPLSKSAVTSVSAHENPGPRATSPAPHWLWPARGKVIASYGKPRFAKQGILIDGSLGEPIRAAAAGTVVYAGSALAGYGRLIIIKHNDEWLSAYGHNQRLLVREGERVQAGEQIAKMGQLPDGTSALYFEIRRDGTPLNPLHFLPKSR